MPWLGLIFKMAEQQGAFGDSSEVYKVLQTDFTLFKVSELKLYLQDRGVSCSDHRKHVLIELCQKSEDLGLAIIKTPDDFVASTAARQTVNIAGERVKLPDLNQLADWCDDLKMMPDIEWTHVIVYLMESCGWNAQQVTSYKDTRGFALKDSNHLDKVKLHRLHADHQHLYIKADCHRQTSLSEKPYTVWVLLSLTGQIRSAGCQCTG